MSRFADSTHFREAIEKAFSDFDSPLRTRPFVGADDATTLEHVTRRHFVDRILGSLGWDLSELNEQVVEEAPTYDETTLRLDYLGLNPESRAPALIVEAKAWATPLVAASAKKNREEGARSSARNKPPQHSAGGSIYASLICEGVEHCKLNGKPEDSPVTLEWAKYLDKLLQYVASVRNQSDHVVKKVALLSGQWLVIFKDPGAIFLSQGPVNPSQILVCAGKAELLDASDEILEHLSRKTITGAFPEVLRPGLLRSYIDIAHIKRGYRALWISHQTTGPSYRQMPSLHFDAAMVLERSDGALLTVVDQSLQGSSAPYDYDDLKKHIAEIGRQSDALLERVNAELRETLELSSVAEFPGFQFNRSQHISSAVISHTEVIRRVGNKGEFLLVTGEAKHFFLESPTLRPCGSHNWGNCQTQGQAQGLGPVFARSIVPKAFFVSGEDHHCANALVHDRRSQRCQIV